MTSDNLGQTYTFDAENRIASAPGVTYTYDGDGTRVKKSNGTLYWTGVSSDALVETDLSGNLQNEYVFFGGTRIARRDASGNRFYTFQDNVGTTHVISDQSGTKCYDADYYPWGAEQHVYLNSCPQKYKFTGKERDESGLDDMGARHYSSALARFMSHDPNMESVRRINPQSWNRYSYVLNSPLILVDPTGEVWVSSNDPDHPYAWQDNCTKGQTCYNQIATQVGETVQVYGPKDKSDIATFNTNDHGYIDLSQIAGTDGAFFEFQSGVTNTFVSPQTAVDLYNAAGEYHDEHPSDSKLSLNDAGSGTGGHISPHTTHDLGRSVDMRYMDNDGKTTNKILSADDDRMRSLVGHFKDNGFNQIYSDNDRVYGTQWAPGHANHIHMGKEKGTAKCEISSCN